jgi:RNA polymerase sigma-70 factor, ECF subfamily
MLRLVHSNRQEASPPPATDRELLQAVRRGDESALGELIERKTQPLLQFVQRILGDLEEARDVVQVTLFRVWENRHKFDDRWTPNTWIYRIASNLAIDQLRMRKTRDNGGEPFRRHLQQVSGEKFQRGLSQLQQGEVWRIFRELTADLPEKQRLAFVLVELEGMSYAEAAQVLGCRLATVRNNLFIARKQLRRELVRRYPEYAPGQASPGPGFGGAAEEGAP